MTMADSALGMVASMAIDKEAEGGSAAEPAGCSPRGRLWEVEDAAAVLSEVEHRFVQLRYGSSSEFCDVLRQLLSDECEAASREGAAMAQR